MREPLIPNNIDLRSFEFMPLDVVRLRDSDFAALVNAEAFRAGILLMSASWHQVPAGSLPDDDRILSNLAGFGRVVKEWKKYKEEALHGWVLCSDGHYYHPVICEKAIESWASKQDYNYKKFAERLRKANMKLAEQDQVLIPSFDAWIDAGMPESWARNSQVTELESKKNSKAVPQSFQENSAVVPQEFQTRSAGIPQDFGHKGTEHNGQGQVTDININNTQESSTAVPQKTEEKWRPNSDHLLNIIRKSKGTLAESVLDMSDFEFHLEAFNAHWENKTDLTENQKTTRFAVWLIDKFDRAAEKQKTVKPKQSTTRSAGLNVNDAWKDQPMNDQPFYGKVELPEGME
ncbi:DUF1376 domain-containing protein [Acinetobacter sp. YH12124]|uniref:DUF1376 domain-containing protein n=1 Tax=Acinetobacter sp. YH12124 TaxID=2601109 RepID=UPI001C550F44|nr:DUF1376 domain-containing protein [Acinetobacter sp. YH12124]